MRRTLLALFAFLCFCCKDEGTPPPPYVPSITIEAVDASCTEAWLRASTNATPATVRLLRDNQRVADLRILTADSLLIDDGLLPNHQYSYQLQKLGNDSNVVEISTSVQLTTMDTTSHNFTWRIDTLGVTASTLYDVTIVDDTLAYAVGEMYLRDSTGQIDPQAWNAAKWNGQRWELRRIPFIGPCSAVLYPPLKAIWAFSATNILVTNGGSIVRYDGANATMDCGMNALLDGAINKIWASAPQDVYVVGNVGTIVHYNGGTWQRVESGTGLDVYDVWGERNPPTGETEILALASNVFQNQGAKLLSIKENTAIQMSDSGLTSGVNALWFCKGRRYYVVGPGIHQKRSLSDPVWSVYPPRLVTWYFSSDVRGTNSNDVFVVGSFREAVHFNGMTWRRYDELMPGSSGVFAAVATKGNLALFVGFDSPYALTIIGRRRGFLSGFPIIPHP